MSARALALKSGSISGQGEGLGRSGTAGQRSGVQAALLSRGWARYDLAKPGSLVLASEGHVLGSVWSDYRAMENMIFGEAAFNRQFFGHLAGFFEHGIFHGITTQNNN